MQHHAMMDCNPGVAVTTGCATAFFLRVQCAYVYMVAMRRHMMFVSDWGICR